MSKFFSNKKILIIIVGAIVAVMVGLLIGSNIVNTMKAKEKAAEKAKIEKTIEERKDIEDKIKKAEADDSLEENHYTKEYKEYQELSDEEKAKADVVPRKEQVDFGEIKKIEKDQKEDLGKEYVLEDDKQEDDDKEVLPKKFNLRDKINIIVGDQDSFGLCWDYASLTSVQTNLSLTKGEDYNFSEGHIDYMTSNAMCVNGREENGGGRFQSVKYYNEYFRGFVLEEEVPQNVYEDYEYNTFYDVPKEDIYVTKYVDFPRLVNDDDITDEEYEAKLKELQIAVKTHVMNYGSVYASIHANHVINQYTAINDETYTNHAISIVGWDDDYSKDNFTSLSGEKPKHDGAYIALNSWGEHWGKNGYFYISYEDYWVNSEMSGVISVNDKNDLININGLGKNVRKYIKDNYDEKIVELDGEEYLKDDLHIGYLDLSNMNIKDIKEFEVLISRASSINLSNNNLESIEGLEDCIINDDVSINLSKNNIKDVSCLKDVVIGSLILNENVGVHGYEDLNITSRLSLVDCGLTSFNVGDGIKGIDSLELSGNEIEDYSGVEALENLYYLELRECGLTSLEKIKNVLKDGHISYLDLADNNLQDISGLENTSIYSIILSNNPEIEDFEPLRKSKGTYYVVLDGCNITDAKNVLLESISAEDMEKYEEIVGADYEFEISFGVTYVLSGNKNISNLGALKNASSITVQDCNLGDISELKELKFLEYVNLSDNHELTGDLSGMIINQLVVENCGLDNDFNLFNADLVCELSILGNNIDNIDNFINKVTGIVYIDSYDGEKVTENDVYISVVYGNDDKQVEKEIEIPDGENVRMDMNRYLKSNKISASSIKVNGKSYKPYRLISVDENTVVSYTVYGNEGVKNVTIRFKVNPNMRNSSIEVIYSPYLNRLKNASEIDANNIRVANTYGNGIRKETSDFTLGSDIYKLPYKLVERGYGDDKRNIFVPEKYYMLVSQGNHKAKYAVGKMSGYNIINVNLCEDLTPPDNFDEEFPILKFNSEELYNIAKDYWKGLYVRADDDLLTIELKEYREQNNTGLPMYIPRDLLYDVQGLKPMIVTDIYILMDMENGMDRIEEEDLKVLEEFVNLRNIHIITPPEEYLMDDLIIPQEKYVVTIENGVG